MLYWLLLALVFLLFVPTIIILFDSRSRKVTGLGEQDYTHDIPSVESTRLITVTQELAPYAKNLNLLRDSIQSNPKRSMHQPSKQTLNRLARRYGLYGRLSRRVRKARKEHGLRALDSAIRQQDVKRLHELHAIGIR